MKSIEYEFCRNRRCCPTLLSFEDGSVGLKDDDGNVAKMTAGQFSDLRAAIKEGKFDDIDQP